MQIAVLGGGLSGLSAAFNLSYRFPAAHILLFEKQNNLGGWARSQRVNLQGHNVLLEGGPRTLRPQGAAVLELIRNLGIENELISVPKSSPAAKKRYIYVPPGQLSGVSGLNTVGLDPFSALMRKFFWPILRAPLRFTLSKDTKEGKDESVHSFASRILGEDMATAVGSAVIHGIYATDSRQLSARSTLPFWSPKNRNQILTNTQSTIGADVLQPLPNIGHMGEHLKGAAVYSFKDGLETIPRALERQLETRSNVQLFPGTSVVNLLMRKNHTFELSYLSPRNSGTSLSTVNPTHVVSALPLPHLHTITQLHSTTSPSYLPSQNPITPLTPIPHLTHNTSSSVHVLNLVFPSPPSEIHPPGFGYLIPRPRKGYPTTASDKHPGILGVVFDSCSTSQQDDPNLTPDEFYSQGTHTKITVMLGGPHPLYIPPSTPTSPTQTRNSSGGKSKIDIPHHIRVILNHLSTHLARPLPDPIYYRLWRNDDCIPTYSIGHKKRMQEMREGLGRNMNEGGWGGKLEVIGAGVSGVSVPDCVLAGRNAGLGWL